MARRFGLLFAILLLVAFLLPSDTLAAPLRAIVTTALDTTGNVGAYSSLVLDANGYPVIAYRDNTNQNLKLAYCNDARCASSDIKVLDSTGNTGYFISMRLDASGNPVISYMEGATTTLKLARCSDPTCSSAPTINSITGPGAISGSGTTSLALDTAGNPVISYLGTLPNNGLFLARCSTPTCEPGSVTTTSLSSTTTSWTSLQLNSAGNAVIAYYQASALKLIVCPNAACSGASSIDLDMTSTNEGNYASLVLDSSDNPVISYYIGIGSSNQDLGLVRCTDPNCTSWQNATVVSTGSVGAYTSLELDSSGNPVISHAPVAPNGPKAWVTRCSTPNCAPGSITTVEIFSQDVRATSLALDCQDNPMVAFYNFTSGDLQLAYDDTSSCSQAFDSNPAPGGTLALGSLGGSSPQAGIDVSNIGPIGKLSVSFSSISAGYSVISGLPINDLEPGDPAAVIVVQCDSVSQPPGTLELATNDTNNPTVVYNLTCEAPPTSGGGDGSTLEVASQPIAPSGVTTLRLGRLWVTLPANAIPPGQTNCQLSAAQVGSSAAYGFSLDDAVFDVKVHCDSGELNIFLAPLTICIQPPDGASSNKLVYHSHNAASFQPLGSETTLAGYVCGQTRVLSLFTLGQLALPATGFAPGRITAPAEQPAELAYAASDLVLSIPKLGVQLDILGVPQGPNGWDVSWLQANQAGYLYGTAFPTWTGNSALTAHVWNADNTPGPFYGLKDLQHGDRFTVTAWGATYVYEVRSNQLVRPDSLGVMGSSDYNEITLLTCESFSAATGDYLYRRAVRAVLVAVE